MTRMSMHAEYAGLRLLDRMHATHSWGALLSLLLGMQQVHYSVVHALVRCCSC